MNDEKERYEEMLASMMTFVDTINAYHAEGVCFGTEDPLYPAEIHTIAAIAGNEGVSLTQLARALGISKPTLSERMRKLVAKGFVNKETNPDDRKAVTLWLTEKGVTADHHHTLHHEKMYQEFRQFFGDKTSEKIDYFKVSFDELNAFDRKK